MEKRLLTLCIVRQDQKVLLGFKKTGFGAGQWNGFGGKVEMGETIEEAAKRELKEESNLDAFEISKIGILNFKFEEYSEILEVHIFQTDKFNVTPEETREMKPEWFSIDELPYDKMWASDILWMPLLLVGKKFKGTVLFDRPSTKDYSAKIIRKDILEVGEI